MAPREPRKPEGNKPDQDSPYEETAFDKLVDRTQDFLGVNKVEGDQENPEPDKEDEFYRPFQHTPGTGRDDEPAEDRAAEKDLIDSKRNTRNTDRDY